MIDTNTVDISSLLKAIGDEHRLEILRMLSGGEMCACEIHGPLGIPQNLASHHLKALRDAGLVKTRREGRWIIYSLNPERLKTLSETLNYFIRGGK
jgi:ArsR family transcriptional regulator, arsenate/arsenite/antimonite-responsive transcriptional repressor